MRARVETILCELDEYEWETLKMSPHMHASVPVRRWRVFYIGVRQRGGHGCGGDGDGGDYGDGDYGDGDYGGDDGDYGDYSGDGGDGDYGDCSGDGGDDDDACDDGL